MRLSLCKIKLVFKSYDKQKSTIDLCAQTCQGGCREFESHRPLHFLISQNRDGIVSLLARLSRRSSHSGRFKRKIERVYVCWRAVWFGRGRMNGCGMASPWTSVLHLCLSHAYVSRPCDHTTAGFCLRPPDICYVIM